MFLNEKEPSQEESSYEEEEDDEEEDQEEIDDEDKDDSKILNQPSEFSSIPRSRTPEGLRKKVCIFSILDSRLTKAIPIGLTERVLHTHNHRE